MIALLADTLEQFPHLTWPDTIIGCVAIVCVVSLLMDKWPWER